MTTMSIKWVRHLCRPKSQKHSFLINFPIFHICREMHNVFNLLLASLCVADSMFLLCNIAIAPVAFGRMDLLTPGDGEIVTILVMMFCSALHLLGMWGLCQLGLEHLHHCQPHIWEISGDFADFHTWLLFMEALWTFLLHSATHLESIWKHSLSQQSEHVANGNLWPSGTVANGSWWSCLVRQVPRLFLGPTSCNPSGFCRWYRSMLVEGY